MADQPMDTFALEDFGTAQAHRSGTRKVQRFLGKTDDYKRRYIQPVFFKYALRTVAGPNAPPASQSYVAELRNAMEMFRSACNDMDFEVLKAVLDGTVMPRDVTFRRIPNNARRTVTFFELHPNNNKKQG